MGDDSTSAFSGRGTLKKGSREMKMRLEEWEQIPGRAPAANPDVSHRSQLCLFTWGHILMPPCRSLLSSTDSGCKILSFTVYVIFHDHFNLSFKLIFMF